MGSDRILVLGGSGFVGRHLVARLAAAGHAVVVPTRRREAAKHLILLPTVDVVEADPRDSVALTSLVAGTTAVINLVGILHERRAETFDRVHVALVRNVIAACKAASVRRLLHMSALHADPSGASKYLRSKGEAEALVTASGLAWTIFAPSVIFGREDSFLNLFARLQRVLPVVALAGAEARFQPVHVGDVAACFASAVGNDATIGRHYRLCGPDVYTLRELVRRVGEIAGCARPIVPLGPALSTLQAAIFEWLPGPLLTRDNLASMRKDSVCGCPFPEVFGVSPVALETVAPRYLAPQ